MFKATLLACLVSSFGLVMAAEQPHKSDIDFTLGEENKFNLAGVITGLQQPIMYNKINDYLVDATTSSDFKANMRLAEEWLDRERGRGVHLFKNKALVQALEQFTALEAVKSRCDRYAHTVLWRNDQATLGEAGRSTSQMTQTPRRIASLVHHAAIHHAIDCSHVYRETFERLLEGGDKQSMAKVDIIMDAYRASNNSLFDVQAKHIKPSIVVQKIRSIGGKQTAQLAYQVIKGQSMDHENSAYLGKVLDEKRGRRVVRMDKIKQMADEHLLKPCKYYVNTFGPDVFIPAIYEAELLNDAYNPLGFSEMNDFVSGWITYRVCELLVADADDLAQRVASIIDKLP